ncbi:MAG: hypothetical protein CL893_03195 [Dehalococcoidia bacterium]|nr:hypothetical protein [Dehalococcoidia bacterium]|tara:strand:- start:14141 stop:15268 length:1128 start_codon:yes stop_codon:yes gene_type:complete
MQKSDLSLFLELSNIPTTSFHEELISDFIKSELNKNQIDFIVDEWGNIEVLLKGKSDKEIVYISHMDHPGFEIVEKIDGKLFKAKTLGGLPKLCDIENTNIKTVSTDNQIKGNLLINDNETNSNEFKFTNSDRWLNKEFVFIELDNENIDYPCPVVFDLPDSKIDKDEVITPVADDLAGCALILETLKILKNTDIKYSIRAIFSRAEEVGLLGARLIAKSGRISKDSIIVSIETSSELPGAISGSGPIIRTGDRASTFDNSGEIILLSAVRALINEDRSFKSQRQLMNLGGCEATAFSAFGYKVTGISLPLINWHNATDSGSVEPERISITDYQNALNIMTKVGILDIVENKDYYKSLIEIPDEAQRLEIRRNDA